MENFKNIQNTIQSYFESQAYNESTDLCEIFNKYGSDKGNYHNYSTFYNYIFSDIKDEILNIFEVGLGTNNIEVPSNMGIDGKPGASIRGWKDYFKNSNIYGGDVDKGCLFKEDRIKTFHIDQTNDDIIHKCWNNKSLKDVEFDILLDDGLHEYNANRNFFENSIHKLKNNGIYILEDIHESYWDNVQNWFNELIYSEKYYYVGIITIPGYSVPQCDNRLGIIVK